MSREGLRAAVIVACATLAVTIALLEVFGCSAPEAAAGCGAQVFVNNQGELLVPYQVESVRVAGGETVSVFDGSLCVWVREQDANVYGFPR
jgi:hypothetical protein